MRCHIRVQGHLDPAWSQRFSGFRITHEATGASLLSGSLPDQAALHGILLQIITLGLPLLSLETGKAPRREETSDDDDDGTIAGAIDRA